MSSAAAWRGSAPPLAVAATLAASVRAASRSTESPPDADQRSGYCSSVARAVSSAATASARESTPGHLRACPCFDSGEGLSEIVQVWSTLDLAIQRSDRGFEL